MTIRRGEPWGLSATVPENRVVVDTDCGLVAADAHEVSLLGGDLYRALGSPSVPDINSACTRLTIDAMECTVTTDDGDRRMFAVSSVVVGRTVSRGRFVCVSNSGWWRGLNIAPRAHPNDGVADVVSFAESMPVVQRVIARRRASTGTHLPHPDIAVGRVEHWEATRSRPGEPLRIDGRRVRGWLRVEVRVHPDRYVVLV